MKRGGLQAMSFVRRLYSDKQLWIVILTIGVWIIALQNFGLFSESSGAQRVYVEGGEIDARVRGCVDVENTVEVEGSVWVNGGDVDVSGSSVQINGGFVSTW